MTHPYRKPESPAPVAPAVNDPSLGSPASSARDAPTTDALLTLADARPAANEDVAASPDADRNPLWIVATGMACLFEAVVMALG